MWSVGKRGDPPMPGALFAADAMSGYQAVIAILAALVARSVSGVGQKVEVDMFSVILDSQLQEMVTYLNTGVKPTRLDEDTAHAIIGAPYGVYQTSNGWITLAMCYLPNLGEALQDDWLKSLTGPKDNSKFRDEIYKRIRHRFIENTTEEWLKIFETNGLWGGPVYDYGDVEFDPHVKATGMIVPQQHAGEAKLRTVRIPIQMSENPPSIRRGAPRLGEDSRSVLKELIGYQDSEIDELLQSGVVAEYVEGKGRPK
jgi:crotonobetainyl-CoA:carnitine CoA-transferase CaiB-like acyl-CoA transferase